MAIQSVQVKDFPNQGRSWGAYEPGSERKYMLITLTDGSVIKLKYVKNSIGTVVTVEENGQKTVFSQLGQGGAVVTRQPIPDVNVSVNGGKVGIHRFSDGNTFTNFHPAQQTTTTTSLLTLIQNDSSFIQLAMQTRESSPERMVSHFDLFGDNPAHLDAHSLTLVT